MTLLLIAVHADKEYTLAREVITYDPSETSTLVRILSSYDELKEWISEDPKFCLQIDRFNRRTKKYKTAHGGLSENTFKRFAESCKKLCIYKNMSSVKIVPHVIDTYH